MLPRVVTPETLDELAPHDPRAVRARLDLRRINRVMGSAGFLIRGMRCAGNPRPPDRSLRILELGAGDGRLMLRIARKLSRSWPAAELTLLDRQELLDADSSAAFERAGWSVHFVRMDVLDWAAARMPPAAPRWDIILANLFLHHFAEQQLRTLLASAAARCDVFVACEPRRAQVPLLASHLVGALGAGRVARQDAVLSVHAGFCDAELSAAWPGARGEWQLEERAAGLFSHFFRAARCGTAVATAV